jgi:tRNA A58 N-methylase Trm61
MPYQNPEIQSSYQKNDLGKTLYDLVIALKPQKIVEFGTLNAYSTVCMAMALQELGRGKIHSYDLWDGYQFKHGKLHECMWEVMKRGLGKYVQFHRGDFHSWEGEKCDLLHLDISNDGNTLKEAVKKMKGKCPTIVFEGGSAERDAVEWMKKYKKTPINGSVPYKIINPKFPSLSIT